LPAEPLLQIGVGFGLNRYSSVSSAVMRIKSRLQKDKELKNRFERIEFDILKSQTRT
jgi:chromosomal replication initiation ATPase DnaA